MGLYSRRKGADGEREIVGILKHSFPNVRRRASGEESQTDRGRDLDGMPGICAQVERGARVHIERKLYEAFTAAQGTHDLPVAFTRADRGEWLATMYVHDFMRLCDD